MTTVSDNLENVSSEACNIVNLYLDDLDGTLGNLGGDVEGLEERSLLGSHTSVLEKNVSKSKKSLKIQKCFLLIFFLW